MCTIINITAIASLTDDDSKTAPSNMEEITRQNKKYFYNFQSEAENKLNEERAQDLETKFFEKLQFASDDPIDNLDYPEIKKITSIDEGNIPMYNALPSRERKFNVDKNPRHKRELLLSPQVVEVFEIHSSKHVQPPSKFSDTREIPKYEEKSDSTWDILGIMSAIRQSFFNSLLTTNPGKN